MTTPGEEKLAFVQGSCVYAMLCYIVKRVINNIGLDNGLDEAQVNTTISNAIIERGLARISDGGNNQ